MSKPKTQRQRGKRKSAVVSSEIVLLRLGADNAMKITIPSRDVDVCDLCQSDYGNVLRDRCVCCGRMYCDGCRSRRLTEFRIKHRTDVCFQCGELEKVQAIVERYAKPLDELLGRRDEELAALNPKAPKRQAETRRRTDE